MTHFSMSIYRMLEDTQFGHLPPGIASYPINILVAVMGTSRIIKPSGAEPGVPYCT